MLKKRNVKKNNKIVQLKRILSWGWHSLAALSLLVEGSVIYMISSGKHDISFTDSAKQSEQLKESAFPKKQTTLTSEQLETLQIAAELIRTNMEALRVWNEELEEMEEKSKKTRGSHKKTGQPSKTPAKDHSKQPATIIQSAPLAVVLPSYVRQYGE